MAMVLLLYLTHLAYRVNAIANNDSQFRKRELADVICYCKMTSFMSLDGVKSFLRLKDVTNTRKRVRHSPTIGGDFSVEWWKVGRS